MHSIRVRKKLATSVSFSVNTSYNYHFYAYINLTSWTVNSVRYHFLQNINSVFSLLLVFPLYSWYITSAVCGQARSETCWHWWWGTLFVVTNQSQGVGYLYWRNDKQEEEGLTKKLRKGVQDKGWGKIEKTKGFTYCVSIKKKLFLSF